MKGFPLSSPSSEKVLLTLLFALTATMMRLFYIFSVIAMLLKISGLLIGFLLIASKISSKEWLLNSCKISHVFNGKLP